uniref:UDG domain-containing protein n=1 Tax=Angiostrongylus cantonensis TaxID=6313 RepID=A0A0K0CVJ2_ANGCA
MTYLLLVGIPPKKACEQILLHAEISVPIFNKPKIKQNSPLILTPPSTPSSPYIEQQIEFLHNLWRAFRETPTGEADPSIVIFRRGKELPPDFEPFNIDRFLAEKLLKELDIDPKFAIF